MIIYASLSTGYITTGDRKLKISSRVRNELNGLRKLSENPVLSIPGQKPIMPRPFPDGRWEILDPQPRTSPELAPYFIPTTAYRKLPVWTTVDGHYGEPTDKYVIDRGYGIHFSEYFNTIGCIKVEIKDDLLWLVEFIKTERANGPLYMEVV